MTLSTNTRAHKLIHEEHFKTQKTKHNQIPQNPSSAPLSSEPRMHTNQHE
ncbi:MAG: hypothetical protein ACKO2P_06335 [Planctomycetota bacterium]